MCELLTHVFGSKNLRGSIPDVSGKLCHRPRVEHRREPRLGSIGSFLCLAVVEQLHGPEF